MGSASGAETVYPFISTAYVDKQTVLLQKSLLGNLILRN